MVSVIRFASGLNYHFMIINKHSHELLYSFLFTLRLIMVARGLIGWAVRDRVLVFWELNPEVPEEGGEQLTGTSAVGESHRERGCRSDSENDGVVKHIVIDGWIFVNTLHCGLGIDLNWNLQE